MTTRNFRVKNGLSVGDITISASANTITGLATAAPSADGDVANKKYVDDQAAASLTLTNKTLTSPVLNTGVSGTAVLDEDNMASDSDTQLATQQSIKAYVDAQVTASDLDFQGDSGGALSIDLDSETLDIAGGTGIDTSGSGNTLTVAIDSTVATLTGSQTLTNKTLTSPVLNTGVSGTAVLDEDNMGSDSNTQLATQQSIKAYVDAQDANIASQIL
jgi:acetamidase/formamidase